MAVSSFLWHTIYTQSRGDPWEHPIPEGTHPAPRWSRRHNSDFGMILTGKIANREQAAKLRYVTVAIPALGRLGPARLQMVTQRGASGMQSGGARRSEKKEVRPKSLRLVREPGWQDGPAKVEKTIGFSYFFEENLRLT